MGAHVPRWRETLARFLEDFDYLCLHNKNINNIGVYQLVDYLIWDQVAAGAGPVTYTKLKTKKNENSIINN